MSDVPVREPGMRGISPGGGCLRKTVAAPRMSVSLVPSVFFRGQFLDYLSRGHRTRRRDVLLE